MVHVKANNIMQDNNITLYWISYLNDLKCFEIVYEDVGKPKFIDEIEVN